MKCPYCPKEIDDKKSFLNLIGKKLKIESNPDFDKHIKKHTKRTK